MDNQFNNGFNNVNQGNPNMGTNMEPNMGMNPNMGGMAPQGGAPFARREVVTAIILSIVTCGIYGIYWWIKMTDEVNLVTPNPGRSGGMCFLLTLITCGIYGIYWYYDMGKKLYAAGQARGMYVEDKSTVLLILGIFGLGIVSEAMIQGELNKFAGQ